MIRRGDFVRGLIAAPVLARSSNAAAQVAAAPLSSIELRSVDVPFDHERPNDTRFRLEYFVAAPFDRRKTTVIVIGDGQQFYIRADAWTSWHNRFGENVNVVGVAGRGFAPPLQERVGVPEGNGWLEAYRLLRHEQWTADIDLIRRDLVGSRGQVGVYGASGGGRLVHEYVSRYAESVDRVMTRCAVFTYLDAELGLTSDHFWDEISAEDRATLSSVLASQPERREEIAKLFQRQNFFVPSDDIDAARHQLTTDIAAGRADVLARLREEYQIDAIDQMMNTPLGAAIRVRQFEFSAPITARSSVADGVLQPDIEVQAAFGRPLLELHRAGRIPTPAFNIVALHNVNAEVLIVAGRHDHTADYRTQIALASCYPNRRVLLLDDNHNFARLSASGLSPRLFSAWQQGFDSPAFRAIVTDLEPLIWNEYSRTVTQRVDP